MVLSDEANLAGQSFSKEGGKKTSALALAAGGWVVWVMMVAMFVSWIAVVAAFPTPSMQRFAENWRVLTKTASFGYTGSMILLLGSPIFILVVLGFISLEISSRRDRLGGKRKMGPRASLQNHPVVVRGLLGVVSAAELLWIVVFLAIFTWIMANYIIRDFSAIDHGEKKPYIATWIAKLKHLGLRLGFVGIICLNLLFLPVSRGSVLLRAIDIPFEHAVKYHVWLGHFTMAIFTSHGLAYSISWYAQGQLIQKLLAWKVHGIANLPGVIALLAGLAMWITSLGWVRQRFFELFFYTHQLYIVFVIFMALHVGDFIFSLAFSGIFLFMFDRFLRFCQSRSSVGVLSAKLLPCGTYELALAKPTSMKYHALSFVFLNVPGISSLQWHPFSVSSSPYDGDDQLKLLVKPLGEWSDKLKHAVTAAVKPAPCPFALQMAVEGPYGHESNYFFEYEVLMLVAGGIGVSPFVAILRDLLQRYQRQEASLPNDINLIWAVKTSQELHLLDLVSPSSICPGYDLKLCLNVHVFVTQELEPSLQSEPQHLDTFKSSPILSSLYDVEASKKPISVVVGSGSNLWVSMCLGASILGYIIVTCFIGHYYLEPRDHNTYVVVPWWVRGVLVVVSMVLGVVLFGGIAIALWKAWDQSSRGRNRNDVGSKVDGSKTAPLLLNVEDDGNMLANESGVNDRLVHPANTHFGYRPNMKELFEMCAKRQVAGTNVGVLVCGPDGLQTSVAEQCRAFNSTHYNLHKVAFSYHSVSFDL